MKRYILYDTIKEAIPFLFLIVFYLKIRSDKK